MARTKKPSLQILEPRIVFDASVAAAIDKTAAPSRDTTVDAISPTRDEARALVEAMAAAPGLAIAGGATAPGGAASVIVFIDSAVEDAATLLLSLPKDAEIHRLSSDRDGVVQIAETLAGRHDIKAVHILAHGASGTLDLGATALTAASIANRYANEMATIGAALAESADILIYGCDFAEGSRGQAALAALAASTGADVAASIDLTGAAALGGNWVLEAQAGAIEARSIAAPNWEHVLTTGNTGAWTIAGLGASNATQGVTATIAFSAISPQSSVVISGNETFTTNPFFANAADGDPSLRFVFNWDTTPEPATSIVLPPAVGDGGTATLTITFSQAVTNPIINLDRVGGASAFDPNTMVAGDEVSQSNSALFTLTTPGATLTQLAGVGHFDVTATTIQRTPFDNMVFSPSPEAGVSNTNSTAAGSVQVNGTFTTITFVLSGVGPEGAGGDGIEIGLAVDGPPIAQNDAFAMNENTTLTGNLFANNGAGADSDPTSDALTITQINGAAFSVGVPITLVNGTLTITNATTGAFTFTPNANYTGGQAFDYTIADPAGGADTATATITVNRDTDGDGISDVTDVDDDNDGILDTTEGLAPANLITNGTFTGGGAGWSAADGWSFNGTAAENFSNSASNALLSQTLNNLSSAVGPDGFLTLTFDVNSNNLNDTVAPSSSTATLQFQLNGVTYAIASNPNGSNTGTVTTANGAVLGPGSPSTFTITTNRSAYTTFTVKIPYAGPSTATFGVAFTANGDDMRVDNLAIMATIPRDTDSDGIFDHLDIDADNDGITDNVEAQTTAGYIAPTGDGVIADVNGDGLDDVYGPLGLTPSNTDAAAASPDAIPDYLDADSDNDGRLDITERGDGQPTSITSMADTDGDGLLDIFEAGTVSDGFDVNDDNRTATTLNLSASPALNASGSNAIPLVRDLTFRNLNEPPVDGDETGSVTEDTTLTVNNGGAGDLLNNATDPDGDPLTITGYTFAGNPAIQPVGSPVTIPGVGAVTINADGSYSFAPLANFAGAIPVITYTVSDGNGGTNTSTLTLTMLPVNDAPVANPDVNSVNEDTTLTVGPATGLLTNDTDIDGGALSVASFTLVGDPTIYLAGQTALISGVGSLLINANGGYQFAPASNYTGPVPVATYTVGDGAGGAAQSTLTITILPVNDPPVATNDGPFNVTEDTPVSGNVLTNDTDADGPTLSVVSFTVPGVGTVAAGGTANIPGIGALTIAANGAFIFTPAPNYNGPVPSATYIITDGLLTSNPATLSFNNVTPVNDAPVATDDGPIAVGEDTPISGNLLPNDSDVDGDPLSVVDFTIPGVGTTPAGTPATIPGVGTLLLNPDGGFTFTPAPNYNGPVPAVTYTISDGALSDTAVLTLGPVTPVNDAPVATDDGPIAVGEDTPVSGNLLPNDSDVDGDPLSVVDFTIPGVGTTPAGTPAIIPGVGTLLLNPDGGFTFTPAPNYNGPVPAVTYTISDGALSDTAVLTLGPVTPLNDAPVATDDGPIAVGEDTPVSGNLLPNDSDVDGDPLSVVDFTIPGVGTTPAGTPAIIPGVGTLLLNPDGGFTFTPAPNYNGPVPAVTYTISDGALSDTAVLTLGPVTPLNDAPVATDDGPIAVGEDTPVSGNLLPNDSDVDGDPLSVVDFTIPGVGTTPAGTPAIIPGVGTLLLNPDGGFTFTPAPNYNGPVPAVTYTISDGALSDTAVLTLGPVAPVNDAPVATDEGPIAVGEDTPVSGNLLPNDSDVDGDPLSVVDFTIPGVGTTPAGTPAIIPGVGTLLLNPDGGFTFTPAPNYNGPVPAVTYTISDGALSDTAVLTLGPVAPVNDAPVATDEGPIAVGEDTPVSGNLLPNDSDVDGDPLSVVDFTIPGVGTTPAGTPALIPGVGTLLLNPDGGFTFTPAPNYNGPVPAVTYTISDGALSDTAVLTLGPVTPLNDAPVATDDGPIAVGEDTPVSGNLLPNDSDVDGDPLSVVDFTIPGVGTTPAGTPAIIPGVGTLLLNPDGGFTFTPAPNYNGPVPAVTYTISDGALSDTAVLTLGPVAPVNDAPVATDDGPIAVGEDTPISGNLLPNDSDVDGDPLSVVDFTIPGVGTTPAGTPATIPGVGTLLLNPDGGFTFTPAPNYNGPVPAVTYTISDGALSDTAVLTLGPVTPLNDAPVATDDGPIAVGEDTPVSGNLLPNDSDVDGDPLSVVDFTIPGVGTTPAGTPAIIPGVGTLLLNPDGGFTFTPAPNYNGPVPAVTYTISDGALSDTAVLTLGPVAPLNDAPVATDDGPIAVGEDTPISGNLLPNDSDVDGDPLSVVDFTIPGVGTTPAGTPAIIPGVGTLLLNPDGGFTFTPAPNYNGPVPAVTYTISDGALSDTAVLTLGPVTPLNDAPVATDDGPIAVGEDTPVSGNLLPNDSDVDGDPLSVVDFTIPGVGTTPAGTPAIIPGVGTLLLNPDGGFTFTPAPNYNGPVPAVTYTISDGALSDTAVLTLGPVAPLNDAPVIIDPANPGTPTQPTPAPDPNNVLPNVVSIDGATPLTVNVSHYIVDPDGDPLTYSAAGLPPGLAIDPATGQITGVLTPTASNGSTPSDPPGAYTATITADDGHGGQVTTTIKYLIVNPPPVTADTGILMGEDTTYHFAIDDFPYADSDGDPAVGVRIDTLPGQGSLLVNGVQVLAGQVVSVADIAAGLLTFTPLANAFGDGYAGFNFSVFDGSKHSVAPAAMTIDVAPLPDPIPSLTGDANLPLSGFGAVLTIDAHPPIIVPMANHELGVVSTTLDVSGSIVEQTVNGLVSLAGATSANGSDALGLSEFSRGWDPTSQRGVFDIAPWLGNSTNLTGGSDRDAVGVETIALGRRIYIHVFEKGDVRGAIADHKITRANGAPAPAWLESQGADLHGGLPPADAQAIDLKIEATLKSGATVTRYININLVTGALTPINRPNAAIGPPTLSEMLALHRFVRDDGSRRLFEALRSN